MTLSFSRLPPFTVEDQEVELSVAAGHLKMTCKFRLKDMMYQGKLAL